MFVADEENRYRPHLNLTIVALDMKKRNALDLLNLYIILNILIYLFQYIIGEFKSRCFVGNSISHMDIGWKTINLKQEICRSKRWQAQMQTNAILVDLWCYSAADRFEMMKITGKYFVLHYVRRASV